MRTKYRVAGIGEGLWNFLPQGKVLGGAPANFAYHTGMLGIDSYIVSAVGKDELGSEIIDRLSLYNIHPYIDKLDCPTGVVDVCLDEAGIPRYEIKEHVAWDYLSLSDQTFELAKQLDVVCFGSLAQRSDISRTSIQEFVRLVPDKSVKVFDVNLR